MYTIESKKMYTIESKNIKIFPCSQYRETNRSSKLFYEQNISNMIRQVTDNPSYIISGKIDESAKVTETLKLTLYGYYVEILEGTSLISDETSENIYIRIVLKETEVGDKLQELDGQDDGVNFNAVQFGSDVDPDKYSLLLAKKLPDNKWELVEESFVKFTKKSILEIDGKHDI